ncbi:hypothetical protein P154DRAFT_497660 [Amniculicola lignicola CBS 123094]|uniref:MYND-type domain-containing protein n=1 Tax=Amniculicola lignicola CBS 123094 TaxID=1392246 RepID=A0A6A5W7C2_9PLEO|nr:hypothetical protein P154DRAFT_497660 [Amniculicola lignicola CBS 123094]
MPSKCKTRERLASDTPDIPELPVGAIRGNLCFRCFSPTDKILKCGACRRAGYCSAECQKLDWKIVHKNHCKIFKTINELEEQQYQTTRTWSEYSSYILETVRSIRDAAPSDEVLRFVVQAQPYCATCRRSAVQLFNRKISLKRCGDCKLVFSCAECTTTPTHSQAICTAYQNYAAVEAFRIDFFEDTGKASPVTCTQFPLEERKFLKDAKQGWYDYFVKISDKQQIEPVIKPDFSGVTEIVGQVGTAEEREQPERMRMFLLCATDNLTMPLTILSALEDIEYSKPSLNIHLVGATGREFLALANFEEILHLNPSLKTLNITAAGPHSWAGDKASPYVPSMNLDCCPVCKSEGRTRSIASYRGVYHDFAASSNFAKPDLVVLFNSGWVDGDDAEKDWAPTIKLLVDQNVPALFTTYNQSEARHEELKLMGMNVKFVVEPEKNKWRGLVPTPEFIDEEYGMWYQNEYRYLIQGKL